MAISKNLRCSRTESAVVNPGRRINQLIGGGTKKFFRQTG